MRPIFIIALLAVASLATTAFAQELVPVRSVTVSGLAKRKVVPDEAHVIVTIGATDLKLQQAKAIHDTKLRKILDIVKKNGIPEKHVSTQSSSMMPIYEYDGSRRIFRGYRMATTVDIKLEKADKLGTMADQLLGSGLEDKYQDEYGELLSTNYTVSDPDRIRDEMLAEAIGNARKKAENIAQAAGAEIARVYQINETDTPVFQPRPMMMLAKKSMPTAGPESDIAPPAGEEEMQATVTVVFELKN